VVAQVGDDVLADVQVVPVHAQGEAGLRHPLQVVRVADRVAAVPEDNQAQVDVLGGEHVEDLRAGGHHDVQLRHLIGAPLDPLDVPALADDGDVDDRVDAVGRQFAQAADGVGDSLLLVAPFLGIVLLDLGGHHEDVLVHQHAAEVGDADPAARGLNCLFHTPNGSRAPVGSQRG
jgi:hypothetical protein